MKKFASIDDNPVQIEMVEKFQCPGCVCGSGVSDGCFKPVFVNVGETDLSCDAHVAGTLVGGIGTVNLGLPKGFNRLGPLDQKQAGNIIRLWTKDTIPEYDHLNIPVWALELDGYLFVRCYLPRVNQTYVDVIKDGVFADLPEGTIDVREFYAQID